MDLETALLMQELMHMREERAELRSQLFLMEKDNGALRSCAQMAATEKLILKTKLNEMGSELGEAKLSSSTLSSPVEETNRNGPPLSATESEAGSYKVRIAELLRTLDQVMESSSERARQDAEVVRELKDAHLCLLSTLEKTKVKYRARIRKLEEYVLLVIEKSSKRELIKNCL